MGSFRSSAQYVVIVTDTLHRPAQDPARGRHGRPALLNLTTAAHTAGEYVELASVTQAARLLLNMARAFARRRIPSYPRQIASRTTHTRAPRCNMRHATI